MYIINSNEKRYEKFNINFCDECSKDEYYFVTNYTGYTFYWENEVDDKYFNMQIFKPKSPLINESQSILNDNDIEKCENILRNKRKLRMTEEIIIVKKDYINKTNKEINSVEYYFYKYKPREENILLMSQLIDISLSDELNILISIRRNLSNYYNTTYL